MPRTNQTVAPNRPQTQRTVSSVPYEVIQIDDSIDEDNDNTDPEVFIIESPSSRQIRATYIPGFLNKRAYVVSEDLTYDRVYSIIDSVWQLHCSRIITISCANEDTMHWEGYWPYVAGESKQYGEYTLSLVNVYVYADYITRVFRLTKGIHHFTVYHFQFTTWRENGLPIYGAHTLINFVKRVHSVDSKASGPALVNSLSDGCRVGTYIICDIIIQELAISGGTDQAKTAQNVVTRAPFLLPNEDQVNFLSEVITEELRIKSSTKPARKSSPELYSMLQNTDRLKIPQLEKEFQVLSAVLEESSNVDEKCATLQTGFTYVDSFRKHNQFIVTWTPSKREFEQAQFWKCVYDNEIKTIVMLDNLDKFGHKLEYWPSRGAMMYGSIKVEIRELSLYSSKFILRRFEVNAKNASDRRSNPLKVIQYQLKLWKDTDVYPSNVKEYLYLVSEVCRLQQQQPQGLNQPEFIIHCRDGRIRSALFCAATHIIEDINVRCEVNPLLAARVVSRNKKDFFRTIEEYQLLYEIAWMYLQRQET